MMPLSVMVAAVGLVFMGLMVGFVSGLITGWVLRDRR
jgi:hypothetical protein